MAVKISIVGTMIVYMMVAASSSLVFGVSTEQDILVNLNPKALQQLMDPRLADVISVLLSVGYALKLILIFPLANWSLRENLSDLFFHTQHPTGWQFYSITYGVLVFAFLASQYLVRGVLNAIDIVGSTACVCIIFVIPSWLMLKFEGYDIWTRIFAIVILALGVFCLLEGVVGEVWRWAFQVPLFC